jgi:CheY-like chemotaxis protein
MNDNEPKEIASREVPSKAPGAEMYAAEWTARAARSDLLLVRMNHEIRTAVNLILGLTEVIRETELGLNVLNNVSVLRGSAERLLKESAEIIDLTRAEIGSLQLSSASFKLRETLQQAMDLMAILASCKRVRLSFEISSRAPNAVIGDPVRLSQILIAIVRGSIERLERGEISVKVEAEADQGEGIRIHVTVKDNGRLLGPETITHLFGGDLDSEAATRGGSELSLALARHLARMMGGDLWAEAEPPFGAVFHFEAKLRAASTPELLDLYKTGEEPRNKRRPLKILVADDSADTLLLIRTLLKDQPWGIDSADNGRTAFEMAAEKSYDLILMDLDMPEMNGYTATRQIRIAECLKEKPAVPIVALTAHSEQEAASKSMQAGCTAHVSKPIRKAALIETIERYAADGRRDLVHR